MKSLIMIFCEPVFFFCFFSDEIVVLYVSFDGSEMLSPKTMDMGEITDKYSLYGCNTFLFITSITKGIESIFGQNS